MHEPAPILPDPESERRGHELRDVAIKPIIIFLIALVVFGGVLQAVMSAIMRGYVAQEATMVVPHMEIENLRDVGVVNLPPPPQVNTTNDMTRMYEEENAVLNIARPSVDRKTGKVHISLERAMEIMARKGLPHRETAPKNGIDRELPYPKRSQPYEATP